MTGLIAAELNRLRSRRAVWIALVAAVLMLGTFQIGVNSQVTPPSAAEVAQYEQDYQQALKDWTDNHQQYEDQCRQQGGSVEDCTYPAPTRADYGIEASPYGDVAGSSLQIGAIIGWLVLFLVGATAVGAEFTTGSIGNWLTFVPKRGAVLASKAIALLLLSLLVGAVIAALALAVPALLVVVHGGAVDLTPKLVYQAARGLGVGALITLVGATVALVTRHTVGAVGIAFGYLVVVFVRFAVLSTVGWAQKLSPWTPEANLAAVFNRGFEYQVPTEVRDESGLQSLDFVTKTVTLEHGLVYASVMLAVVVVLSTVVFLRRDVN